MDPGHVGLNVSAFHAGELAVQDRAGVADRAARMARPATRAELPPPAREFLAGLPYAFLAGLDWSGRPWAAALAGPPGFLGALGERTIGVRAWPAAAVPLRLRGQVGLLAIDLDARKRMKAKGTVERLDADGFVLRADRVYALCAQYIQRRELRGPLRRPRPELVHRGAGLTREQLARVEAADTFVVATHHTHTGADASHRGGYPGFLVSAGPTTLVWPDYAGNRMFNTLGNIEASGRAGLLVPDFDSGRTLNLTGRAEILWETDLPGAERAVRFEVEEAVEVAGALPDEWVLHEYSRFNPGCSPRRASAAGRPARP
jgi:predicted pyridoxine 5'-phosphate oxidase superfamily flavin-nucleotide-binding protein